MSTAPLRLYWWNDEPNFGDRLSQAIVALVSNREVQWTAAATAELFAIGSILHMVQAAHAKPRGGIRRWVKRKRAEPPSGRATVVWGSGVLCPQRVDFPPNVRIAAVRGPLTAMLLGLDRVPMGDPGILASSLFPEGLDAHGKIGIVEHHSRTIAPELRDRLLADGRFKLIDVADPDHIAVVQAIGGCRHVYSSSLHGLIVADSFGITNTWLDPKGIHPTAELKFYDYALSVGRILNRPINLDSVFDHAAQLPKNGSTLGYAEGIAASRAALLASFPGGMMAKENDDE